MITKMASSFCDLYRLSFSDHVDELYVIKRYVDNPYDDLLMCVAIEDGEIIANAAAIPTRIIIGGKTYKAAVAINVMVHPSHKGKGLYAKLAHILYDDMKTKGYSILYVFPNYISNRIFIEKLGHQCVYEIPTLELDLISYSITMHKKETKIMPDFTDKYLEICKNSDIYISKEHAYMTYRYENHPYNDYSLAFLSQCTWAVLKQYQDILNIVEFHSENTEGASDLLHDVIAYAKKIQVSRVTTWSKTNTYEHLLFEKTGFRNKYPITYFSVWSLDSNITTDIYDYRKWNIQMGDDYVY